MKKKYIPAIIEIIPSCELSREESKIYYGFLAEKRRKDKNDKKEI